MYRPSDRDIMLASPYNFEALDADLGLEPMADDEHVPVTPPPPKIKHRFKKLVRMMLTHTLWLKDAAVKGQKDRGGEKYRTEKGEKLTFNLNAFRAHIQTCGKLSPQAISILAKPSIIRTELDVKQIQKIIYRLKCFDRYPLHIKQELSRVVYYDKFGDGRLIIKQGHSGLSFYFIVSGSVVVERAEFDPFTKEYYVQKVGELHAGDSFGELALLHNTKRAASIICRGTSEFLRIDKGDFDEVLRNSHQREWEMRINLLSTHPVFAGWTTRELKIANGHAKMKTYPPNSVIVSEKKPRSDRVFFIASGHCTVVRRLELVKRMLPDNKYKYLLPPLQLSLPMKKKEDVFRRQWGSKELFHNDEIFERDRRKSKFRKDVRETRYFTICELGEGEYFNVGESMDGLYVISVGRVEVVQVGTLAFARHSDRLRNLEEMKQLYLQKLPTCQQTYETYVSDRKWKCYKKNLVNDVISRRRKAHAINTMEVPGIIHPEQIYYMHVEDII